MCRILFFRINYYPFGLKHKGYNNVITGRDHKYGFQEQEIQEELGLNWIQFKWRNHDPAIGRFMNIDPLTEDYRDWGPYVFSGNRVIDARELEGLEPHSVHETLEGAATNYAEQYNGISIRANRETVTNFYSTVDSNGNESYSYTRPAFGSESMAHPDLAESVPKGSSLVGNGHTHGSDGNTDIKGEKISGDNVPTSQDLDGSDADYLSNPSFLADFIVTPNGTLIIYIPTEGEKGEKRYDSLDTVNDKTIPSDPGSNTRKNNVSPNVTPDVLPIGTNVDDYKKK